MAAAAVIIATSACESHPSADIEGPRVVTAPFAGPRAVGISTFPTLVAELSEPLAPDANRGVALVAWPTVGSCAVDPVCPEGSCEAGHCQRDPVKTATWRALDGSSEPDDPIVGSVPVDVQVEGVRIVVRPRRALAPHQRFSLLFGSGVRDRAGSPLVDDTGIESVARFDFVTAGEGSGGPEPRLATPRPDDAAVAPNLPRLAFEFRRPVIFDSGASVSLVDEYGHRTRVVSLSPCEGWVPGFCATGQPEPPLVAERWYRVEGSTLVDARGRSGVPPHEVEWFRTATTPDLVPPSVDGLQAVLHGPCAHVQGITGEMERLVLRAGEVERWRVPQPGTPVGVRIPDAAGPYVVEVEAFDAVGHAATAKWEVVRSADRPRLELTEVLANAAGTESASEFIEVRVPLEAPPLDLSGLFVADVSWPEVLAELDAGEGAPGDPLPDAVLAPGEVALVVGEGFVGDTLGALPPSLRLLRVRGTIAAGGLKNAGEAITIYRPEPPTLVTSYGDWFDTSSSAFDGVSVVAVGDEVCDLPARWRVTPGGLPSPGMVP